MADILNAYTRKFNGDVLHLLNQEGSKLRGKVMEKPITPGSMAYFDRLGRGSVQKVTSRLAETANREVAHSRRRLVPERYDWVARIDEMDAPRTMANFAPEYAKACAADLGVEIDKVIIAALNGNAYSVGDDLSASTVALPSSQIVDEDFGSADSNLTLAKLLEAKRKLLGHAGSIDGDITLALNADALMGLINDEKTIVGSIEYNNAKSVLQGELARLAGMNTIVLADKDGAGDAIFPGTADGTDTDPVRVFAFIKRSVGLGIAEEMQTRIDTLPTVNHATQIRGTLDFGATRIEEEGVVAIECVQS